MTNFTLIQQPNSQNETKHLLRLLDQYQVEQHGPLFLVDNARTVSQGASQYRTTGDKLHLTTASRQSTALERRRAILKLSRADIALMPESQMRARSIKLREFDTTLDAILKDLRLSNDIDEKKRKKLIEICDHPDFNFDTKIPGLDESPLEMIIALAYEDPDLVENKSYIPYSLDTSAVNYIDQHSKAFKKITGNHAYSVDDLRQLFPHFIAPKLPAARARSQAIARTELSLDLLEIAKSKGIMFGANLDLGNPARAAGGSGFLVEKTANPRVAHYLIDNGANYKLNGDQGEFSTHSGKEISKLAFYLFDMRHGIYNLGLDDDKVFEVKQDEITDLFVKCLNAKEEYNFIAEGTGHDAVSLVLFAGTPANLTLKLLEQAKGLGYNFKDFHLKNSKENLLQVLLKRENTPSVEVVQFLLDQGVEPYHKMEPDVEIEIDDEPEVTIEDVKAICRFTDITQLNSMLATCSFKDELYEAQEAFKEVFGSFEETAAMPLTAYEVAEYKLYQALAYDELEEVKAWANVLNAFG